MRDLILTEKEVKRMFVELFFWVVENKPSWLQECIAIKKANLLSEGIKNDVMRLLQI